MRLAPHARIALVGMAALALLGAAPAVAAEGHAGVASWRSTPATPRVAASGGGWQHVAPLPTGRQINGLAMVSAAEGWMVTTYGGIYHTTDGGVTGQPQPSGTVQDLNAVRFTDALHGSAVGNAVVATSDGGATWQLGTRTGNLSSLYAEDFVSVITGYAVGGGGVVMKTTDGGHTWAPTGRPPVSSTDNLLAVNFVSTSIGWTVGANGDIAKTTNGGASWMLQPSGTTAFLTGVSFINAQEGWATGGNVMLHTVNGGLSWTPQTLPATAWLTKVQFLDAHNGWAAGTDSDIIHTVDGGATWVTQQGGVHVSNQFQDRLEDLRFSDALHGLAVGTNGVLYGTVDGGSTWTDRQQGYGNVGRVVQTDASHLWASSDFGFLLSSTDGGLHWSKRAIDPDPTVTIGATGLTFTDNNNGWLVTDIFGGNAFTPIRHTTDGGLTWPPVASEPPNVTYDAIDTVDNVHVVATVASILSIKFTADGGRSWATSKIVDSRQESLDFIDVDMVTPLVGYVIGNFPGDTGSILKTIDGGATFRVVFRNNNITTKTPQVSFSDARHGWGTGMNGVIYHTADGGKTWQAQQTGTGIALFRGVHAVSQTIAWAVGSDNLDLTGGAIARTVDGGMTWTVEHPGAIKAFNGVTAMDGSTAVAGGLYDPRSDTGGIYKRLSAQ